MNTRQDNQNKRQARPPKNKKREGEKKDSSEQGWQTSSNLVVDQGEFSSLSSVMRLAGSPTMEGGLGWQWQLPQWVMCVHHLSMQA